MRLAIIDNDQAFVGGVLTQAGRAGVSTVELAVGPAPPAGLRRAKLEAILVDPAGMGPAFWSWPAASFPT